MSIERPTVTQIIVGFSDETDGCRATGSVTLVEQSGLKILIDCGDPWNGGELINKLMQKGTACSEITHVVITHGHVDHCGNLNLFKNAQIFMAFDYVTPDGIYSAIDKTDGYQISEQIKVTLAKGHTSVDLIVEVINTIHGTIIIAAKKTKINGNSSQNIQKNIFYIVSGFLKKPILLYQMIRQHIVCSLFLRLARQEARLCSNHADWSKTAGRRNTSRQSFPRKRIPGVPADRGGVSIDDLVRPRDVAPSRYSGIGAEEYGKGISPQQIGMVLDEFARRPVIRELSAENGLNAKLFMSTYKNFKHYCSNVDGGVEPALLVTLHDIITEGHNVDTIFPFFLSHARKMFPHLEAMDDLRMISDLTQPHNWYPEARTIQRKIIFHAGPTNSGKTYHALKRFAEAKSGVYCGPLKLLAAEVFTRSNENGLKCDMVTGEERRFAVDNHHPSAHLSSTIEMLSTQMRVELAVIDEIQMLRDEQRGWAWTRALLGAAADEVHLCGETAAIDIVTKLLEPIGEHVEVRHYERKTPLTIATQGLGNLDNVQPGDCIVCFSRKAIFSVSRALERKGIKPALIYGDLPPNTKMSMAAKFNDPNDPCNVLVATDAVGMGLNLNIKRVIFHTITRLGELLPTYAALQIAGRAGRYGTSYADGVVTTFRNEDIAILRDILSQPVEPITAVGISPTFEQIETFSFHLPQASFVHLLDLFMSVSSISDHFFICTVNTMKELAEVIDYIPLPLKVRYTFCICPINIDRKLTATVFVKMARRFSSGQCLTYEWLMDLLNWPPQTPKTLEELMLLEDVFDVFEAYLWLSLRFPDMLSDEMDVRNAKEELDSVIQEGVENIISLLENQALTGKEGSIAKKMQEKARTARQKEELEETDLKLPSKRKGKRKSVLEALVARVGLTDDELQELKNELRDEEKDK